MIEGREWEEGGLYLLQSLCVIVAQTDLLPHMFWAVGSFDGLDIEIQSTFLLANRSVS